jgi:GTP cyclohydrolase II
MNMCDASDCLKPTLQERLVQVRGDIRLGLPCLITHEGTAAVMVAIETLTPERFGALQQRFGDASLVISANRAQAFEASSAAHSLHSGPVRIQPPEQAPLTWYQQLSDTRFDDRADRFSPLLKTSAGDMALEELALKIVKSAKLLPAAALYSIPANEAIPIDLKLLAIDAQSALRALEDPPVLAPVASAGLPLEAHAAGRLHIFRDPDGTTEHCAVEIGNPDRTQPVLSRLHSACFTGDVLGSLKCDCGPQLRASLALMGEEGAGVLLYLNQEGRGIGLANKMRVYDLQADGLDTVEANHRLGYDDDERDFRIAATMLRKMGFSAIRLLTNNPAKTLTFRDSGIIVTELLPLRVGSNQHNREYLAVKALKSGHTL